MTYNTGKLFGRQNYCGEELSNVNVLIRMFTSFVLPVKNPTSPLGQLSVPVHMLTVDIYTTKVKTAGSNDRK